MPLSSTFSLLFFECSIMIQKCNVPQDKSPSKGYVSCIKINGVPILPPLITSEKSKELQRYRNEAIRVEERLRCERKLRTYIKKYHSQDNLPTTIDCVRKSAIAKSIESELAFSGHSSEKITFTTLKKQEILVPSCLKRCFISCTNQMKNNDIHLYEDPANFNSNVHSCFYGNIYPKNTSKLEKSKSFMNCDNEVTNPRNESPSHRAILYKSIDVNDIRKKTGNSPVRSRDFSSNCNERREQAISPKPRLIRSNSYTLDSPSPILLECLQRKGTLKNPFNSNDVTKSEKDFLSTDSTQNWSSLDTSPIQQSKHISINSGSPLKGYKFYDNSSPPKYDSGLGTDVSLVSDKNLKQDSKGKSLRRSDTVACQVQNITVDLPVNQTNNYELIIPNDISRDYPKRFFELLDDYKRQQQQRIDSYTKLKKSLLEEVQKESLLVNEIELIKENAINNRNEDEKLHIDKNEDNKNLKLKWDNKNNFIISENEKNQNYSSKEQQDGVLHSADIIDTYRSCEYSLSSQTICIPDNVSVDSLNIEPKSDLLIDFNENNQNQNNVPLTHNETDNQKNDIFDIMDISPQLLNKMPTQETKDEAKKELKCIRKLFPNKNDKSQRKLKEQWAATILCAAAKGYLVRRLMKTERVQTLIQTIKEAVLCAIQLHSESVDKIQPADIELHRRLIQQVTAACCDFHDVFFNMSKKQQMSIISVDRQRVKLKMALTNNSPKNKLVPNKLIKSKTHTISPRYRKNF